jgi:hypothetical protein
MTMENSTDLIKEIQQDITQEKIIKLLLKYGKHIIVTIVLFLLAFSIYTYFKDQNIRKQKLFAEEYQSIFLNNPISLKQAPQIEDYIAKTNSTIFEYLATFYYSKLLAANNNVNQSLEMLLSLSKKNTFPEISNLSLLLASEIAIEKHDTLHRSQLISALSTKLKTNDKAIPHFYIMQIMLINLLLEDEKQEEAKEAIKKIETNVPSNISLLRNMLSNTIFTKNT